MLQSIKEIYGHKLTALDGEIGTVKKVYFDQQKWGVRYLIAETGGWLTSRQVLISPCALNNTVGHPEIFSVNLTRRQIEDSPHLEWHKPVSRRFEEAYYRYYNWPRYWQGDEIWGASGIPMRDGVIPPSLEPAQLTGPRLDMGDGHLWSTRKVDGYHVQTRDGIVGCVSDFMMDARAWVIRQLVIKVGHPHSGAKALIPMNTVVRIGYEQSSVFTDLTVRAVEQSLVQQWVPLRGETDAATFNRSCSQQH